MAKSPKAKSDKAELRKIANREANQGGHLANVSRMRIEGITSHKRPSKALRQWRRAQVRQTEAALIEKLEMSVEYTNEYYADTDSMHVKDAD